MKQERTGVVDAGLMSREIALVFAGHDVLLLDQSHDHPSEARKSICELVEKAIARSLIGRTAIEVKDVPGFAVNHVLHAFMIEAVRPVEEGVATPADIDLVCKLGLGQPMGPFELMDATISRLCLQARKIIFNAYGERFCPRPLLKQRVEAGYDGGKGKPGWRIDEGEGRKS